MSEENNKESALVPRLRFPEFRGAGEWEKKELGEVINLEYGRSLSEEKRNGGVVPVVGSNGIVGYHDEYLLTGPAIVIGRKGSVGEVNWIDRDCYPIDTTYFVNNKNPNGYLLPFLNVLLQHSDLSRLKDSSAVPGLNRDSVHSLMSCFPKPDEQQKIADCLSSLDELITAETQKLNTLKTHKKGLMQQLFPREGETVPRLRFPEFREAGEWEEKAVGEVFRVTRGEVLAMPRVKAAPTAGFPYPVYSSQTKNKGLAGYYSEYLYEDAITWTTDGANAGEVNFRPGKFYCTNVCGVLLNSQGWANTFVAELLNSVTRKYVSYVGNPKLMNRVMSEIVIPFPSLPEQKRIADCLSSLDDFITAQSQKIEALKTHKKGLMQQLFPSSGGVAGEAGRGG